MMKTSCILLIVCAALLAVAALVPALLFNHIRVINRDIEPPDVSDLALEPREDVPDEENALTWFLKARDALAPETDENGEWFSLRYHLHTNRADLASVAKIVAENELVFQHLRQGVSYPHCVFPAIVHFDDPTVSLINFRLLGSLLVGRSLLEQDKGDDDTAMRDLETLSRLGQLMRQTPSCLVEVLMGCSFEGMAFDEIQRLARNPRLSEPQLKTLLEEVERTPPYADSLRHAIKAEFHWQNLVIDEVKTRRSFLLIHPSWIVKFISRYGFLPNQTKLDTANLFRSRLANVDLFYSDANRLTPPVQIPTFSQLFLKRNGGGALLYSLTAMGDDYYLGARCELETQLAATKIILACHLFQRATGRMPETLDELVPDYFSSIPLDPYDGQLFRYNAGEGTVYSVGIPVASGDDLPQGERNVVFKVWE